jgi:hypothetical protein
MGTSDALCQRAAVTPDPTPECWSNVWWADRQEAGVRPPEKSTRAPDPVRTSLLSWGVPSNPGFGMDETTTSLSTAALAERSVFSLLPVSGDDLALSSARREHDASNRILQSTKAQNVRPRSSPVRPVRPGGTPTTDASSPRGSVLSPVEKGRARWRRSAMVPTAEWFHCSRAVSAPQPSGTVTPET